MLRWVGIVGLSSVAFAANSYTVKPLAPPAGLTAVQMTGINNTGQVAGYGSNGTFNRPFISSSAGSVLIPLPAGSIDAVANAINASGTVAGYFFPSNQAFIGTTSGITVINPPATWTLSECCGVNDSGQIAALGFTGVGFVQQAFVGTPTGSTPIPNPPAPFPTQATDFPSINNLGQVAASVGLVGGQHAFIGTPAGSMPIVLPPGWGSAIAFAVNDSGQVAGFGFNGFINQAYIGTPTASIVIPLPGGAQNATTGFGSLNNSAVVVGQSEVGGWIWDSANGTRLLNSMVPPGWNVTNAISISNNGLILAQAVLNGGATQYVELAPGSTPIPPGTPAPPTFILLVIGAACCFLWLRPRGVRAV